MITAVGLTVSKISMGQLMLDGSCHDEIDYSSQKCNLGQ